MHERYLGIDSGAETIKFILLERQNGQLVITSMIKTPFMLLKRE
jgi:activator of 2-hydroxyglutaryl-CoA dehydratase